MSASTAADAAEPAIGDDAAGWWRLRSRSLFAVPTGNLHAWLIGAAFALLYGADSILRHSFRRSGSHDLGIFTAGIRQYAHGHLPVVHLDPNTADLLGEHFDPVIALIAPFFLLYPRPDTLLAAQAVLFGFSAVPLVLIGTDRFGRAVGSAVGIAYGLSFGLLAAVTFDFHEIAFAPLPTMLALRELDRGQYRRAALWALTLVFVKEELGAVIVAPIGAAIFLRGARRLGLGVAVAGCCATAVTILWVIPHFNPHHVYPFYGRTVSTSGDPIIATLNTVTTAVGPKLLLLSLFVLVTAGAVLRSPYALLLVPDLVLRLVSSYPLYYSTEFEYNSILMPFLFFAALDGVQRWRRSARPLPVQAGRYAPLAILLVGVGLTVQFLNWGTAAPMSRARLNALDAAIAHVPANVKVEASDDVTADLAARDDAYSLLITHNPATPYLIYDQRDHGQTDSAAAALARAKSLHPAATYEVTFSHDGFYVLRRLS
jgi:uncharacterized membrane protein